VTNPIDHCANFNGCDLAQDQVFGGKAGFDGIMAVQEPIGRFEQVVDQP